MSQRGYVVLARQLLRNLRTSLHNMTGNNMSLSATSQLKKDHPPPVKLSHYEGLDHLPRSKDLSPRCTVDPLEIKVEDGVDGTVPAFLHVPREMQGKDTRPSDGIAAILLSGAGGGVVGPSSIYISMADKLASLKAGVPVMRLDYRFPARNKYCVDDVLSAMDYLEQNFSINRFVLVGWSFGGAPVFTVGGMDERVVGCATVASQTAETEGIRSVGRRGVPVLLLHGTGDSTLSHACSQRLYDMYGAKGERRIELFPRDDHALTKSSHKAEEMLADFILACAGIKIGDDERKDVVRRELIDDGEKIRKMQEGGDLRGVESIE